MNEGTIFTGYSLCMRIKNFRTSESAQRIKILLSETYRPRPFPIRNYRLYINPGIKNTYRRSEISQQISMESAFELHHLNFIERIVQLILKIFQHHNFFLSIFIVLNVCHMKKNYILIALLFLLPLVSFAESKPKPKNKHYAKVNKNKKKKFKYMFGY